jgi:hypothetical protein
LVTIRAADTAAVKEGAGRRVKQAAWQVAPAMSADFRAARIEWRVTFY